MKKRNSQDIRSGCIRWMLMLVAISISLLAQAQIPTDTIPRDPSRISVFAIRNLNFGSFSQGAAGGTITISPTGLRSVTGSVVAINQGSAVFPALFEVEAPAGVIVTLQNGADATLTGSNGGTMTLRLGTANPVSPFTSTVTPPGRTQVSIGGTLTVGNPATSRPGNYSGTFSVIFFQQ